MSYLCAGTNTSMSVGKDFKTQLNKYSPHSGETNGVQDRFTNVFSDERRPHIASVVSKLNVRYSSASSHVVKMTIPGSRINYSYRKPSPGNNETLVIIGGVTAGLCVIMIAVTLILVHRREKRERELQKGQNYFDYSFDQHKQRSESFFATALRNNVLPRDYETNGVFVVSKEESQTSPETPHGEQEINQKVGVTRVDNPSESESYTCRNESINTKSHNGGPTIAIAGCIPNEHLPIRSSLSQNVMTSSSAPSPLPVRNDIFSHRRRKTWDVFERKTETRKKMKEKHYSDQCSTPIMLSHSPVEVGIDNGAFESSPHNNIFL